MTAQAHSPQSSLSAFDWIKVILAVTLLVTGMAGFYYYIEYSLLYRTLAMVGVALVSAGLFFTTAPGRGFLSFFQSSRAEVHKVVWPLRQETIHTTIMVVVMVLVVGLILWLLDSLFLWLVRLLTGQGGW
ncbi:MAG: preprotein translocase subunit SecE [Methylothermaceae bacterium]|nr:preprotein translocase subunit SecE [Methylothermaceae bacterium]